MGQSPKRHKPYDPNRPASAADQLRDPKFLKGCKAAVLSKAEADKKTLMDAVASSVAEGDDLLKFDPMEIEKLDADILRAIVYEQIAPDEALMKIRDGGRIEFVAGAKTSDTPLNYLHKRVRVGNRITDIQYNAAMRYLGDKLALGRVGSNTAATIDHLVNAPTLTPEDKADIAAGVQFMRCGAEVKSMKDPSNTMLAAAWRAKRLDRKLDGWEIAVLNDLVVAERTVGMIAERWGMPPEAAGTLVRLALWKLARIYESLDREFQGWLAIERQVTGEARP